MSASVSPEYSNGVKRARTILVSLAMFFCISADAQSTAPAPTQGADHTFDQGSGLKISNLNSVQIDNLVLLGQVWGFLKYHHPAVAPGQKNWDYELFRQLPALLAAQDQRSAAAVIVQWVDALGPVNPCSPCASDPGPEVHMQAPLEWLGDVARLTPPLSQRLQAIHGNRSTLPNQFYVRAAAQVGNPLFEPELSYAHVPLSDAGFRLLAVYRFWNIIEYWFPYRDVMGEDWQQALRDAVSSAVMAPDGTAYQRALMALIARVHDTHANLWSSIRLRPPTGDCKVATHLRFIEGRLVVSSSASDQKNSPLQIGDELVAIDGKSVATLVQEWRPYYAASNEVTILRDIARSATHSECKDASLIVRRSDINRSVTVARVPVKEFPAERAHDKPGEAFQILSGDVAYLKLSNAKKADLATYITSAARTRGLVIDIRNYPAEFMVLQLAGMLVSQKTPFVQFTRADLANPGVFRWSVPFSITPAQPHYEGKVVVLVDEVSQSQAEYTAMALRAVPGALVVGSTTAGTDGNLSSIPLPGNLRAAISGIGVFYPDRRPTQRVGIVPDLEVRPTIQGLKAARDEVLEAGVNAILLPQ